jgi:DNA-binding MarR family transcriptional regulator
MAQALYRIDRKTGTLEVLLSLHIDGSQTTTHICQSLRLNRATITSAIDLLADLGLVVRSRQAAFPYANLTSLTTLGQRVVLSPLTQWPSLLFEGDIDQTLA